MTNQILALLSTILLIAPATDASDITAKLDASSVSILEAASPYNSNAISRLEKYYSKKIGVYAIDTNTGTVFSHRQDEPFPIQSTFKILVAALLLKMSETKPELLDKKIEITEDAMVPWHPITGQHLPNGAMSLKDLAQAVMSYSDNVATNFIMKELGGPQAITRFARTIGNTTFNVEHYEAHLSSNPKTSKDTSTPKDMAHTLQKLLLGNTLSEKNKQLLLDWMKHNTTGSGKIRAGVPTGWSVADKTGSGAYGIVNDIGIVWQSTCKPIVLAIYTVSNDKNAPNNNEAIAETTSLILNSFMKQKSCSEFKVH